MRIKAVVALCALAVAPALYAAPADDVKALLEKGDAKGAYELGRKNRDQLGDPAFDFYFGIAAIDAGHAGEGVFALERYLLNYPENTSARLQLARGYYVLGDDARARDEFEAIRKLEPSPEVASAIDKYLDSIRLRESRYSFSAGAYVDFGIGHDSNVNAGPAPNTPTGFTLNGAPITIGGTSQRTASNFSAIGLGGYVNYPVRPGISLFATGQGEQKNNFRDENKQFDIGLLNAAAGVSVLHNNELFRFSVTYDDTRLGTSSYRKGTGGRAEWQHQFNDYQSTNVGLQYARLKYGTTTIFDGVSTIVVTDQSNRDADFYGVNATYRHVFRHSWEPVVTVGLSYGDQDSRTGRDDLTPRTYGATVGLTFMPVPKWGGLLGYAFLKSDYKGPDVFTAPDDREDRYHALSAAVSYLYNRNLSFRLEALWSRNNANSEVYEYRRDVYLAKVRYEFR